jgi:hypothetical protein
MTYDRVYNWLNTTGAVVEQQLLALPEHQLLALPEHLSSPQFFVVFVLLDLKRNKKQKQKKTKPDKIKQRQYIKIAKYGTIKPLTPKPEVRPAEGSASYVKYTP